MLSFEPLRHWWGPVRKEREMNAGTELTFSFLFSSGPQAVEQSCPYLGCIFPIFNEHNLELHHRHAQMFVS